MERIYFNEFVCLNIERNEKKMYIQGGHKIHVHQINMFICIFHYFSLVFMLAFLQINKNEIKKNDEEIWRCL